MNNITYTFKLNNVNKLNKFIEQLQVYVQQGKVIRYDSQYMHTFDEYILTVEMTEHVPLKDLLYQPSLTATHWKQFPQPSFFYDSEKISSFWKKHVSYKNTFYQTNTYIHQCKQSNLLINVADDTGGYTALPHPIKNMADTPLKNIDFAIRERDPSDKEKIRSWIYVCPSTGVKCIIYNTEEYPNINID
jgi:hypothetical protein